MTKLSTIVSMADSIVSGVLIAYGLLLKRPAISTVSQNFDWIGTIPSLSAAILRAAHDKAVRCPLPGKCLFIQAWQPLAGRIAQNKLPAMDSLFYDLLLDLYESFYFFVNAFCVNSVFSQKLHSRT